MSACCEQRSEAIGDEVMSRNQMRKKVPMNVGMTLLELQKFSPKIMEVAQASMRGESSGVLEISNAIKALKKVRDGRQPKKDKEAAGEVLPHLEKILKKNPSRPRASRVKNDADYIKSIPDLSNRDLSKEIKAIERLIEKNTSKGGRLDRDLQRISKALHRERDKRTRPDTNPITKSRGARGRFIQTFTPSKEELEMADLYFGGLRAFEGKSPREMKKMFDEVRSFEGDLSRSPSMPKLRDEFVKAQSSYLEAVNSTSSSAATVSRRRKRMDDAEKSILDYAALKNLDPKNFSKFMDHANKKARAARAAEFRSMKSREEKSKRRKVSREHGVGAPSLEDLGMGFLNRPRGGL